MSNGSYSYLANCSAYLYNKSAENIKPIVQKDKVQQEVIEQIKVYSEQDHFVNCSDLTIELYERFRNAILNLSSDIDINPRKRRISFRKDSKIFADIAILNKTLKIWINLKRGQLDDSKGIAKDVSSIGHWGNGDYQIQVNNDKDLEYIMSLVKQGIK